MNGQGLIKGLGITLKHFFQKEITEQYPDVMPDLAPRFRGCLQFEFEKCIACGICVNSCPNNVLSFETEKDEKSKKKKLLSYTIDFQHCMFCNLCAEGCPKECIYFDQNFELSSFDREDIKMVYLRPAGMDIREEDSGDGQEEQESKEQKQIDAMQKALQKNPGKVLSKIMEQEEDITILSELMQSDEKTAGKIAELMVKDKEKAAKVATGFVNKEKKKRLQAEEGGEA
ncbi:nadh-ubiquinone oxidoreductase chain i [hydrocarbon metagenome]|uniref:Nadh-ubiquinone oxidoreductase chain i n=1 Tax=hydrocarbon metagenome TaxID=938273 RepID=A0A0W8E8E4_9ZZZZ